ncbi:MAG: hypothetical protein K2N38_03730 [Oscillospiraceae bacterium]|nr:hypothetical protein [Oscillospiraceae bacterium]
MKTAIERLADLNFKGSRITDTAKWGERSLVLNGEFAVGSTAASDIKYFTISFNDGNFGDFDGYAGAEIDGLNIVKKDELFDVKLSLNIGAFAFDCKRVDITPMKYRGMSRRNMYEAWFKNLVSVAYIENEKYFEDEETHELDGFTLNIKNYSHLEDSREYARLAVCELTGEGLQYQYRSTSYSNPHTFFDIIRHSNGHRYFPFHIDLYGISYLDVDSGEVYHYIPEGYEHDADRDFGESFIITDIHYDPRTNLIAYGGCYWAGPSDVMVGDFSEPLNFEPYLVSTTRFIDPEHDECWDINFSRFEEKGIVVHDKYKTEFFIEFDKIRQRMKE